MQHGHQSDQSSEQHSAEFETPRVPSTGWGVGYFVHQVWDGLGAEIAKCCAESVGDQDGQPIEHFVGAVGDPVGGDVAGGQPPDDQDQDHQPEQHGRG